MEIGLYSAGTFGWDTFGTGRITAVFHCFGTVAVINERFTRCASGPASLLWSSPHKYGNLDRILRLQKRAVRIITRSSFIAHSASLFKALNILTIYDLTHLSVLVYM